MTSIAVRQRWGITVLPPPDYTVSSAPSSATIRAGQSATFTISAAAVGGYTGQISLQCSALPSKALCAFSPAQISLNGSQASSTLTITTTATFAQLVFPPRYGQPERIKLAWLLALPGALGIIVLRKNRSTRKWEWALGLLVILMLLNSCGGSGMSPLPIRGTPPGSYIVSVTTTSSPSSSGTSAHSLSLMLNIN